MCCHEKWTNFWKLIQKDNDTNSKTYHGSRHLWHKNEKKNEGGIKYIKITNRIKWIPKYCESFVRSCMNYGKKYDCIHDGTVNESNFDRS